MLVKSKTGTKCPKEGKPRNYITDSEAVTVPDSAYYHRLVSDGSLIIVSESGTSTKIKKGETE